MTRILWTLQPALLLLLIAGTASAQLIESWQFNDPAGTMLTGLTNDVGTATFPFNNPQATTDGSGALEFTQGADSGSDIFRNATLTNPNQTTGIFEMEFAYLSADLSDGGSSGANVGFAMRDGGSNTDLFLLRLHKQSGTLRIQTRIGNTNTDIFNFGTDTLSGLETPLVLRAVADLDTDLLDVYYTIGGGAEQSSLGISIPDVEFDIVRLVANTNTVEWGATDEVNLDYLTVTAMLPPPPAVTLEVNTTTGLLTVQNNSGSDIDMDFYEVTSTASLNPLGWNSLQDQNLPGFPAGDGSGNGWEELGFPNEPGDFNSDGIVDAGDYTVWRDNLGGDESVLAGNGDGSSTVDFGDYLLWEQSFGNTATFSNSQLAEAYLLGSSLFQDTASFTLGNAFQIGASQDLAFRVRLTDGTIINGDVVYVSSSVSVPEPTSAMLVLLSLTCVLTGTLRRTHHG